MDFSNDAFIARLARQIWSGYVIIFSVELPHSSAHFFASCGNKSKDEHAPCLSSSPTVVPLVHVHGNL
jgi:hypothetical protein